MASTGILFVVNNSADSHPDIKENNSRTISYLREIINSTGGQFQGMNIAFIDASSSGYEFPSKIAGVGLARKIGMDAALSIIGTDNFNGGLIIALDADCTVSQNYLKSIFDGFSGTTAGFSIHGFYHTIPDDETLKSAITAYEIFLRYYVLGLSYAGSAYALHTIGSAFACRPELYIKCEGMNKLKAGEDFYFIEKMAKQSDYLYIKNAEVNPSPRPSKRVPFGTGRAVLNYLNDPLNRDRLYNPEIFSILKLWLQLYNSQWENSENLLQEAANLEPKLEAFLRINNFVPHWNKIMQQSVSAVQREHQKKIWFDGFRTLKLVHHLRDTALPNINSIEACLKLFDKLGMGIPGFRADDTLADQKISLLSRLREIT